MTILTDWDQTFIVFYIVLSVFIALIDIFISHFAGKTNTKVGRYFKISAAFAAVVDISYLVSILTDDAFLFSLLNSIYFSCIDVMLVSLLFSIMHYTRVSFTPAIKRLCQLSVLYAIYEIIILLLNPFTNFVISYEPRNTVISCFEYKMHFPFWMHLAFSYLMIVCILYLLVRRMINAPHYFKRAYACISLSILFVVAINALFLYFPTNYIWNLLDISIFGYSVVAIAIYWFCFEYNTKTLPTSFKSVIFDAMDRGIILFDYDGNLIISNSSAKLLLPELELSNSMKYDQFISRFGIDTEPNTTETHKSLFIYPDKTNLNRRLRCDISSGADEKGRLMWKRIVLTNGELENDLLTGFLTRSSFDFAVSKSCPPNANSIIAACDINGLAEINRVEGRASGDQKIMTLANAMKAHLPSGTIFVRWIDAILVSVSFGISKQEVRDILKEMSSKLDISFQYAVSEVTINTKEIGIKTIEETVRAMSNKKMLDVTSGRSASLAPLVRALRECDADTEEHVKRTQALGNQLGIKIGLSDADLSDLSLLCILHDIGKIAIPLEILNKPGRLTAEEMDIIKTHPAKGYEILSSSPVTEKIAEMVLCHHECWDGSGYPSGIKGTSIPLLSRIISIVDSFDAMTNDRIYRPARSIDDALNELKRCSGTQFDPDLVKSFENMIRMTSFQIGSSSANRDSSTNNSVQPNQPSGGFLREVDYCRYTITSDMQIISADEHFSEMTGYSSDDIRNGLYQLQFLPKEDRDEYLSVVTKKLQRESFAYIEHRLIRKNGNIIYVMCLGRRYFDPVQKRHLSEIMITDSSKVNKFNKTA